MEENTLINKRISLFILLEILLVVLLSIPLFIINPEEGNFVVTITALIFMFLPLVATIITKKLTKDKSKWLIKPNFKGNIKYYFMAVYMPGILILLGAIIYFLIFPSNLDLSLEYLKDLASQTGQELTISSISIGTAILFYLVIMIFSPLIFINHILAYGEESGWRGYLLPLLIKKFGAVKAVLLTGALWGLVHAPLVVYGLNYTGNYWGRPFTGIIMMILFATFVGILLSYVTIKTQSIIPASISHGVVNALAGTAIYICNMSSYNPLIGPAPTGIVGMLGFIIIGIILLVKLNKEKPNNKTEN